MDEVKKIAFINCEVQNAFEAPFAADVFVQDGKISALKAPDADTAGFEVFDCQGLTLMPGLIDRHLHGGYGCDFNTASQEAIGHLLEKLPYHGVTAILPTVMTDSIENINRQLDIIKNVKSQGAEILGVHLEGPFLNPLYKGIHPEKYLLKPTVENLRKIDTSFVKILSYAPEIAEEGFEQELTRLGIIPSAAHSDCDYDTAVEKFKTIKSVTHIFNAMRGIKHRDPGMITEALLNNEVFAEIICDMQHIHPAVVQMFLKLKNKEHIVFISDALPGAYGKADSFAFGGEQIFLKDGKAVSEEGTVAGSILFLDDIFRTVNKYFNLKPSDFIGYTSLNSAKSLKLQQLGSIKAGNNAHLILADKNLVVKAFMIKSKFGKLL
ncbi:MAG: N-acetylglucosamine-6-phosphate deacetylase [Candidatus Gastranaerophilales bacterium]|nr:N-acetylglucosamine-6-phosphate deacetylase [Candidatus Gastranaerophilales bacterium]